MSSEKVKELAVVWHIRAVVAVLLPFKHGCLIELELDQGGDERPRWIVSHGFESTDMFVQVTYLSSSAFLQIRNFRDFTNVCLMNEMRTVVYTVTSGIQQLCCSVHMSRIDLQSCSWLFHL